jgi:hypothetical protein
MTTKHKTGKQNFKSKDKEDNKKFIMILAISTVLLIVLMYIIFVR